MTTMTEKQFEKLSKGERMNTILEGTAYWAKLQRPGYSERYKTTKYEITLGLDEAGKKKATDLGLKVFPADQNTPMPYVKISRKVKDGVDEVSVKPELVDSMQKPIPSDILIGNGSKVIVKFGRTWHDNNGGGISTHLWKVQVTKLVEYKSPDHGFVKDETGYVAPERKATGTDSGTPFDE